MLHNTPTIWLESNNPSLYRSQGDSDCEVHDSPPRVARRRGSQPLDGRRWVGGHRRVLCRPRRGVFIGFVLGVYVSEVQRVGAPTAWPSTKAALRAVGVSMLLELTSTLLATVVWIIGVIIT